MIGFLGQSEKCNILYDTPTPLLYNTSDLYYLINNMLNKK